MARPTTPHLTAGLLAAAAGAAMVAAATVPALADGRATAAPAASREHPYGAHAARGKLVSAEHLGTMSAGKVRAWLASDHFDATSARYGVDTYRLVYRTVDTHRRATTASGLLVLPRNGKRMLRTVSYTHGTMSYKPDAPSTTPDVWGPGAAITYGSAGFATVAPDYLGLGRGPGVHPWKDVPSETSASLDMLRAAREFVPRKGRTLDGRILVTGFSQGASSALGLARALQDGAEPRLRLQAVAPISGGYDFRGAELPALLKGRLHPKMSVAYASYLLTSWNRIHGGIYRMPAELFQQPYAGRVERYFDSTTPGEVMLAGLPDTLGELLTPRGFDVLRHPSGTFAQALRVDGEVCTAWTPRVPVRLYEISKDEQAANANTAHCAAAFKARGVEAPVIDVGDQTYGGSRHLGSNLSGTALAVRWFTSLNPGR
ncbi:alpha/beta hydrolase family protein [Actinomadura terrae]|uniref:alpha/beta hydrolase family protein n=1 Tax=Actinomadura terrae TaxID=604353 RepID=UPI001FA7A4B3|nr:lipase family protein [Actinomadura terrae]